MSENLPVVSVVMPAYNSEAFIERSVRSVLSQSFDNWELIIVDDCSSDGTLDVISEIAKSDSRIVFIQNSRNLGVASTRNNGIKHARGKYVAFLDSDDEWSPNKLEKQIALLRDSNADLCYTSYALLDLDNGSLINNYIVPSRVDYDSMLRENYIGCSTVCIKNDILQRNMFNPSFYHEDYVLWLTLLKQGIVAVGIKEVLVNWSYRRDSRSFNKFKSVHRRWVIYRDALNIPLGKRISYTTSYVFAGLKKYSNKN